MNFTATNNCEKELNNSFQTATKIPLEKVITGSLKDYDDVDYYKFTLSSNKKVKLTFSHSKLDSSLPYWKINLYNSSTKELYNFKSCGDKATVTQNINLKKGTYYIVIDVDYYSSIKYALKVSDICFVTAPTSLNFTSSTSSVKLSWKAVSGANGYRIFKYDAKKGAYTKISDTKSTTYTNSKLKAGTTYRYAVKAYKTVNGKNYWSGYSSVITTATKPGTPTLKATAGAKKATLSWNKQTGASGYVVYMSTSNNGKYGKIATVKGGTKVSYTKTGLTKGKTYYFKVRAYKTVSGKNIYGAYSAVKSVKAK